MNRYGTLAVLLLTFVYAALPVIVETRLTGQGVSCPLPIVSFALAFATFRGSLGSDIRLMVGPPLFVLFMMAYVARICRKGSRRKPPLKPDHSGGRGLED